MHPDPVHMPKPCRRPLLLSRAALLLTVLAVAFLSITASGSAAHRAPRTKPPGRGSLQPPVLAPGQGASAAPAQGIFDSCNLATELTTCEQDLVQMHQTGLQVAVVSAQWGSLADISAYAAFAQSVGMSVMWELNDPGFWGGGWIGSSAATDWNAFATACGCTDTTQVLDFVIRYLSALPGTYGYYAADDWTLTPDQTTGLHRYVSEISSVDPAHTVMVGSTQGDGTTYYASGATMGNEIYPETTASLMPYANNLAVWDTVQQSVTQDQRAATASGTQSAFILQAFSFGDNLADGQAVGVCTAAMTPAHCASLLQYPSQAVQLELRNEVLRYAHPKLILWYTFSQASQGDNLTQLAHVVQAPLPARATTAGIERARGAAHHRGAEHHRRAGQHQRRGHRHQPRRRRRA